ERALVEIEERRRAMERRQHLEETLARLQGSVWSEEERAGCEAEAESLRAEVERLAAGKPEWGAEPLPASLTRAEIEAGRREIQHKLEVTRNRRLELERQVGWLESSRDGKTSAIRLEI